MRGLPPECDIDEISEYTTFVLNTCFCCGSLIDCVVISTSDGVLPSVLVSAEIVLTQLWWDLLDPYVKQTQNQHTLLLLSLLSLLPSFWLYSPP